MKHTIKLFLFLLVSISSFGQEVTRVLVNGAITAPLGEPVEGIHIYNISSQKGTVTNEIGFFEMEMAENDRLEVTALQFVSFKVIVDNGIIKTGQVKIYMNPAVNQLEEVIIRPYDLAGNITVDVGKITTFDASQGLGLSYEELTFAYDFAPDAVTAVIGNVANDVFHNGQTQNGLDFRKGIPALFRAIFGSKEKLQTAEQILAENDKLYYSFRGRFTDKIINSRYGIPEERTAQFIDYLRDKGIPKDLMKLENELLLYEFIAKQSAIFLVQIEE
ncbi:hypothetical protein [Patiriisocius marinus]|uniref:hypothetical protein n=1 Tax=Patiriisocius marinus TaxID=1397112 RepID=UPI00232C329F|nr:hypothetical protein [Patiriisocius marinus]